MNFDFLFQNFEGVLSLIQKKAKILTYLSLAGLLVAVSLTVMFAFNIEKSKYIPGIIVLGSMMVLKVIFLLQGNYHSAVRVIFILPLAIYFLFINNYYAISTDADALKGIQLMLYAAFLFLFVFSYSIHLFWIYYLISLAVLVYFMFVSDYFVQLSWMNNETMLEMGNPFLETTVVAGVALFLYRFFETLITSTAIENSQLRSQLSESMRQTDIGILVLQIQRDKHGEKSGMLVIRANTVFERNFRVIKEEMHGVDFSEIFPKLFRDSFNWQEVFYHSSKSRLQVYIQHLEQWFIISNVYPEPDMIVSSFINISALKNESERLMVREQRLTKLMGSLPDIFFIIERDGTYIDYVTNNEELMKLSQDDIIGKTIFEMGFSKPMSYQIFSSIQYVLEHDNIETIEYGMELSSGKTLIFEMRLARLNENQIISIGRDITAKKDFEHQLVVAKEKTEAASRLKAAFLENISHEMRTPMNAIIGFSNLSLEEHFNEAEKRNFLDIVIRNGEQLMGIITDVIDISELESGTMNVKLQPCLINELFAKLYSKYQKILQKSSGKTILNYSLGHSSPNFELLTDAHLLNKIMGHLIDNAIKFTASGEILFGYTVEKDEIKFFVKDTGIGINQKDTDAIYQQFHQTDNRLDRKYSGTGIGLTIVKYLTELLGGSIEFESKPGKGSTFYFYLARHTYMKIIKE
ncbi:MAG: ATP-binding protein [Prolixibacteraceae bacterium]